MQTLRGMAEKTLAATMLSVGIKGMGITSVLFFILLTTYAAAHSGGLNKKGCHAGSQPYHCHRAQEVTPSVSSDQTVLTGKVTHVRDGDTIEVNGIAIRLAALDCPERGTQKGDTAARIAQQFQGSPATCDVNVPRLPKLFFC